jgi:hypothetical protein
MMLVRALLSLAVITGAALAFPAEVYDAPLTGGTAVQDFKRGASVDVACPKVEEAINDAVRVVMYPGRDDTSSGVAGVLVLERKVDSGVVHIRVPDIPDLKDHIVQVKVFYISAKGQHACNAGRYRLV